MSTCRPILSIGSFALVVLVTGSISFSPLKAESKKTTESPEKTETHVSLSKYDELASKASVQPFFNQYCTSCHGEDKQKGQVRLDNLNWKITNNDTAQRWQDILDQLNAGDMPPEDEKQPSHENLKEVIAALTRKVDFAQETLADHRGEIKIRRLNRREYINSIQDLLGLKVPKESLPEDAESEHFDTVGDDQFFTSLHLETYLDIGKNVAKTALVWTPKPLDEIKTQRFDPCKSVNQKHREAVEKGDRQMEMKKAGKSWEEMGFKDAGDAKILFTQFHSRVDLPRRYLELPQSNEGVYLTGLGNQRNATSAIRTDPRAEYKFRMNGGVVGNPLEIRKIVTLRNRDNDHLGSFKFKSPSSSPEIIETLIVPTFQSNRYTVIVQENYKVLNKKLTTEIAKSSTPRIGDNPWSPIWLDWVEYEGPIYPAEPPLLENIVFPEGRKDEKKPQILRDSSAREFIEQFCYHAFRRQKPDATYTEKLHLYFKNLRKEGQKYEDAMAEVMGIILSSPKFLYIVEPTTKPAGQKFLNSRELAVRLSYFLWSAPPDDELYDADLTKTPILDTQINRLLNDPRSDSFKTGFMEQWAELERYDAITVDPKKYQEFTTGLRHAARQEPIAFFSILIDENLPAENLIDSNFVTVNHAVAQHYGLSDKNLANGKFAKITLPAESPRGGLATQTAFLALGSNGERTSPVIRGAFLMEKLLHDKPLPPPPNVPELGDSTDEPLTNRELVKLHQQQEVCASCHEKMDAIGFGLENFDAIGRWRDTEIVKKKQVQIDSSSTMPNGASFKNVTELKKLLIVEKEQLAEELVKSIMSYGLGRTILFSDQPQIDTILRKLRKDDFRVRSMIKEVALSELFRKK
ncbi:MAG: DUF1588 domain-containing protein [Akkermansiaceae bacterium]